VIATADRRRGLLLVLLSATGFASLAILGKVAYDEGLRTAEVLALRFGLAAPLLWLLVFARGRPQLPRSAVIRALAMGAVGYALQATLFFAALARIPAGLTALLLYLYRSRPPRTPCRGESHRGRARPRARGHGARPRPAGGEA
jgi:drug/metabolite transporter (DMT)-like permease